MRVSQFDPSIDISNNQWAITLIRTKGAHAEMIIEGSGLCMARVLKQQDKTIVDWQAFNQDYWCMAVHLVGKNGMHFPKYLSHLDTLNTRVSIQNLTDKIIHHKAKTPTYIMPPIKIRSLLCEIENDILNPPKFNMVGDRSLLRKFTTFTHNNTSNPAIHNCITWIRQKLETIDLCLPTRRSDILFTTTMQYTDRHKFAI